MSRSYIDVTRELSHRMPSQISPQGSEPSQVGGVFCQISLRDFNPITAQSQNMSLKLLIIQKITEFNTIVWNEFQEESQLRKFEIQSTLKKKMNALKFYLVKD